MGYEDGFVSGNTTRLKKFAALVNIAWDNYLNIAIPASGTWQFDDSNHSDYPIIKTNIVSGQRDYTFTTDESGNLILDIYKVMALPSATATIYEDVYPVDQQTDANTYGLSSENTTTGSPILYDKTANAIFLDPIPGYNATNGLKVYINREPSYFTYTDTIKKPGCPGLHHKYFYLRPALDSIRQSDSAKYEKIAKEVRMFEGDRERGLIGMIEQYYSRRSKDEPRGLRSKVITFR